MSPSLKIVRNYQNHENRKIKSDKRENIPNYGEQPEILNSRRIHLWPWVIKYFEMIKIYKNLCHFPKFDVYCSRNKTIVNKRL